MHRRDLLITGALVMAGAGAASCQAAVSESSPEMLRRLLGAVAGNQHDIAWLGQRVAPMASLVLWGEQEPLTAGGTPIDPALARLRATLRQIGTISDISLQPGRYLTRKNCAYAALSGGTGSIWITWDSQGRIIEIGVGEGQVYAGVLSVTEFGARGDGGAGDDAAILKAYQELLRRGGGTLLFPPGRYRLNLKLTSRIVNLKGAGNGLSILEPADIMRPILQAGYTSGEWKTVEIASLEFAGVDGKGCGYRAADTGRAGDEYAGRTRFLTCSFKALEIAVERPYGQIGLWIENCRFEGGKHHLLSHSSNQAAASRLHQDIMHSGVMSVRSSHFQGATKACIVIDSQAPGSGQFLFEDCVMESNPGLVFDVQKINGNGGFPGLCVRRCWNEANGAGAGGTYARLANVPHVLFDDTPVGPLQLSNAQVTTTDSSLDLLTRIEKDTASTLVHVRARSSGDMQPQGLVRSVAASVPNGVNRAPIFTFERPISTSRGYSSELLASITADTDVAFVGSVSRSTTPVVGAMLPGFSMSRQFEISAGENLFPPAVRVRPRQWLAWTYLYRLVEGEVPEIRINGQIGVSAARSLSSREWETLGGMAYLESGSDDLSIWHSLPGSGRARINFGGLALLQFNTAQAALDYLNARTFPVSN